MIGSGWWNKCTLEASELVPHEPKTPLFKTQAADALLRCPPRSSLAWKCQTLRKPKRLNQKLVSSVRIGAFAQLSCCRVSLPGHQQLSCRLDCCPVCGGACDGPGRSHSERPVPGPLARCLCFQRSLGGSRGAASRMQRKHVRQRRGFKADFLTPLGPKAT